MIKNKLAKGVVIFCAQVAAFSIMIYGLLYIIYGGVRLSFFEMLFVCFMAFLIGYIPFIFIALRRAKKESG